MGTLLLNCVSLCLRENHIGRSGSHVTILMAQRRYGDGAERPWYRAVPPWPLSNSPRSPRSLRTPRIIRTYISVVFVAATSVQDWERKIIKVAFRGQRNKGTPRNWPSFIRSELRGRIMRSTVQVITISLLRWGQEIMAIKLCLHCMQRN